MSYTYRYIPASIAAKAQKGNTPKDQYIELFQQTLNDQFYNSSDWWTIQEETSAGSGEYTSIDVRISHVINAETGLKLGDDWKTILFKEINHSIELGRHYTFDNSTWLTVNTEYYKNLTGSCTVRRCNNTLRWIDELTGIYYEEPCCIEYLVKEPRDYVTQGSPFITPGGFLHIEMQFNARTNLIRQNQRFLFGNPTHWTCYKVIGTGVNDFRNVDTYDNTTTKILTLDLIANFVNDELDDIVNGIADVNTNVYSISLNYSSVQGAPGSTIQLVPSITYNGNSITRSVEWDTSSTRIATVSASGLLTLNNIGSCTITANVSGNPASAICLVTVTNTPTDYADIRITPDINYVLESASAVYSVYLYENGVQQADTFTITCNGSNVPSANYTFSSIDGNHFSISNVLRDVSSYLVVSCVTGIHTKTYPVRLVGGWLM